jgi:hypothetical protein
VGTTLDHTCASSTGAVYWARSSNRGD